MVSLSIAIAVPNFKGPKEMLPIPIEAIVNGYISDGVAVRNLDR